ncbi:PEP-CTERM sorting domain-containing protein [Allorhodopirellula solitaria]|uniref:PEP-CTERM motif protein n=1 Tax=Allorhodopirellula solitaria TaxID=2527987 RepID=A0A5C5X211_9BACT|nr:PEP-CTERM sorting domain-containing protein [Allorhodopirellula solitaria]TWT56272.1 PEP-CTERM motif protein [Allorhodopirellula solitaria]
MLRKFLCVAALAVFAVPAQAGLLGSVLTFNGLEDLISTTSPAGLAAYVDLGATGYSDGDIIYGFVVAGVGLNDSATGQDFMGGHAVAMFSAQLMQGSGGYNLVAPDAVSGYRLGDLIDPVFAAEIAGVADDVVAVMLSGGSGSLLSSYASADNSSGDGLKHFGSSDYDLEIAAGLQDMGQGAGPGFFQFEGGSSGGSIGLQRGGFNVLSGVGDLGSLTFKNVASNSLFSPPATTEANIALDTTFVKLAGTTPSNNGWTYQTTSDGIRLNAVPEPATILAFTGLGLIGLCSRRRRRS